jgi:phosphoribosylformylglycinamidine synthase
LRLSDLAAQSGLAPWELLFSESPCRLVVMVSPLHAPAFERRFAGLPLYRLGTVTTNDRLTIDGPEQTLWIDANLGELKEAWRKTLREL